MVAMTAEIIPFTRHRSKSYEFHAPDGRSWCASAYMRPHDMDKLKPGRDYTPGELVRLYGLPTFNGRPGLHLSDGDKLPKTVRYVVIELGGQP